jgi:pimeloyl-ACP methyl ester carboxylesterase
VGGVRAVGLLAVLVASALCAPAAGARVVSLPVAFHVADTNTSGVPCPSDGATYRVRGHLTGPEAALRRPRAVTLYLFGYDAGEWNWRLTDVPGYDTAAQLARLGHVSLTIDELGYGSSDRPADGMATCMGAQADMAHQIVGDLRTGAYSVTGLRAAPRFGRVMLAGHDIGGELAEIEAYSYHDVDGLIEVTWADQGQTPYIIQRAYQAAAQWCTLESPSGYHTFTESADEFRELLFFDADPAVLDAAVRHRAANPCGMIRSTPTGVPIDKARTSEVTVPVLIVFGDKDQLVWTRDGEEQQAANFTASRDVTTAFVPDAGHFPMLERSAPQFRQTLAVWLARRGA